TPEGVKCTTFSILFARYKADLLEAVKGASVIDRLQDNDRVLIAEACSHHAIEDDIGRVKIPKWLKTYTGKKLKIEVVSGRDYPENLKNYKLVIHCGGCMFTRRQMLARVQKAREDGAAITNYGVAIAKLKGILDRVLSPFEEVLITA
ncbi:MAG TPA: [FeFe] hydrogenase H-cluster maturation GTPase HydF, partial [Candidatus Omnitrophota bacterium]|nr:[FeFe] hydrogenase H-cluster maturation GTPase HydF [Candidatus Omnitrophota bacterium]